jgi:phosphoglycolate phosphatase-like HAD superfamily hydrolase
MVSTEGQMVRAWLFDLDGTLLSSLERFHAAYCSALKANDRAEVDEATFIARYRAGKLVTSLELPSEAADGFWQRLMETFLARTDLGSPLPGASAALTELAAKGYALALVTGRACTESALRDELRGHDLDSSFGSVATLGELTQMRLNTRGAVTKKDVFARACAELEVEPGEAALVADWPAEVDEGLEFGFAICIGVLTGGYLREDFRTDPRVRVVGDLTEFPELLASIEGTPARAGAP